MSLYASTGADLFGGGGGQLPFPITPRFTLFRMGFRTHLYLLDMMGFLEKVGLLPSINDSRIRLCTELVVQSPGTVKGGLVPVYKGFR